MPGNARSADSVAGVRHLPAPSLDQAFAAIEARSFADEVATTAWGLVLEDLRALVWPFPIDQAHPVDSVTVAS